MNSNRNPTQFEGVGNSDSGHVPHSPGLLRSPLQVPFQYILQSDPAGVQPGPVRLTSPSPPRYPPQNSGFDGVQPPRQSFQPSTSKIAFVTAAPSYSTLQRPTLSGPLDPLLFHSAIAQPLPALDPSYQHPQVSRYSSSNYFTYSIAFNYELFDWISLT